PGAPEAAAARARRHAGARAGDRAGDRAALIGVPARTDSRLSRAARVAQDEPMSSRILAAAIAGALLVGCATGARSERSPAQRRGPLPARSNGPLAQTFMNLRPRAAATTAPGRLDLRVQTAYS